jgi:hypothetical protein
MTNELAKQHEGQALTMAICAGPDVVPSEIGRWYSPQKVAEMIADLTKQRDILSREVELLTEERDGARCKQQWQAKYTTDIISAHDELAARSMWVCEHPHFVISTRHRTKPLMQQ